MLFRKSVKFLCAVSLIFIMQTAFSQDAAESADQPEISGEVVPDDGTVSDAEESSGQSERVSADDGQSGTEDETEGEETRAARPQRRQPVLQLLDAHGPDFTDSRIPGYSVPAQKNQILADVDEPELQTEDAKAEEAPQDDKKENSKKADSGKESVIEKTVNSMDYSARNLIAWGSLVALLLLMFLLYRLRTGKRRRRVFRKIPSKRR